jgi:hypothetical protein
MADNTYEYHAVPTTYHARRRFFTSLLTALMLGFPFMRIRGESALRFDVPTLKLYFFGSVIWIGEEYYFLLVFLLFFLGVTLFTVLYGRIWCGWACPQTVLSGVARSVEKIATWFIHHRVLRILVSQLILILVSSLVSANLICYFVSPYTVFHDVITLSMGPWTFWSWIVLTTLIYVNLAFVRQKFCASACPYDRFQSFFIDAQHIQGTARDATQTKMRRRVLGLSASFGLLAVLFAYQVYVRMPLDFRVMRDEEQPYHQVGVQGQMMNAYSLIVENRGLESASFRLSVSGVKDAELVFAQNPFLLHGNSFVKLKVYVLVQRKNLVERVTRLHFILENTESKEIRVDQEAPFVYSDRSDKGVDI